MHNMTATDIVLILTCVFTGVCSVIAALKSNKASKDTEGNKEKLEKIHDQTNGNLSEMKLKQHKIEEENARLQRIIQELANAAPPGSLNEIKTRDGEQRATDTSPKEYK